MCILVWKTTCYSSKKKSPKSQNWPVHEKITVFTWMSGLKTHFKNVKHNFPSYFEPMDATDATVFQELNVWKVYSCFIISQTEIIMFELQLTVIVQNCSKPQHKGNLASYLAVITVVAKGQKVLFVFMTAINKPERSIISQDKLTWQGFNYCFTKLVFTCFIKAS